MSKKHEVLFNRDPELPNVEEKKLAMSYMEKMDDVDSICSLSIYHGEIISYLDFVHAKSEEEESVIYEQKRDYRKIEKKWHLANTIFTLGSTPPVVPESIRLHANCVQHFGEREVYEEQKIDPRVKIKKRTKIAKLAGFKKTKKLAKKIVVDKNIMQNTYTYPNGFSFTWNIAICPRIDQLSSFLHSVATFMRKTLI